MIDRVWRYTTGVKDADCVAFLQWALPQMSMRWRGLRKVRGQACKRIGRRIAALRLGDLREYRAFLASHPAEWDELERACRVTISRFFRDRGALEGLARHVLPELAAAARARGAGALRCWSAGCASGEEPYTLALLWRGDPPLEIVATDVDPVLVERARRACYDASSLREVPRALLVEGFEREGEQYRVRAEYRSRIGFRVQNIRRELPEGSFDLVLCRNLAFTYFDQELQRLTLSRIASLLRGALVVGGHERLPTGSPFAPWPEARCVYRAAM